MITYLNKNGQPMIRRCSNCVHFKQIDANKEMGYCKQRPLMFAFTHEPTVYAIVRNFYVCEIHQFINESTLSLNSEPIDIKTALEMHKNSTENS